MKLFINETASRIFKRFLILTVGLPILVFFVCFALIKLGVANEVAIILLFMNLICFTPIHFLFGDSIMPTDSFGPEPGVLGFIFAILFYVGVSYILGNVIGFIIEKGNAS